MNKSIVFLMVILFSCSQEYKINKDFDTFFEKYFTNLGFKLERTKFPIKNISKNLKALKYWTKENWLVLGKYNFLTKSESGYHGLNFKKINESRVDVIFNFEVNNLKAYIIHRFIKENNKWYLYETEDQSVEGI